MHINKWYLFRIGCLPAVVIMFASLITIYSYAKDQNIIVSGLKYDVETNDYDISAADSSYTNSTNTYGLFSITGDISENGSIDGFHKYEVNSGTVIFDYAVSAIKALAPDDQWHIVEDKTKKVADKSLDSNILNGAIILEASIDGEHWVSEFSETDIFVNGIKSSNFYETKEIQQINGCYFKVHIAYREGICTGTSWGIRQYSYQRHVEEYKFYIEAKEKGDERLVSNNSFKYSDVIKTDRDKGYSGQKVIDANDMHYNWSIGDFNIGGYTRKTTDTFDGSYDDVYLKNPGDKVTLWFTLKQDINALNGNPNLKIAEDVGAYDQYFQVCKTNFKHGTLIIQYTDKTGEKHDPIVYTDFLAANACTGADTKVNLFEEGDYEVALDYEVVNTGKMGIHENYRIQFSFKIRNGNCMVYPFDITYGNELKDGVRTSDGFVLDMAKSKYLTIDVQRYAISLDSNNKVCKDERYNAPAYDGEKYTQEGMYVFTVNNLYTGESTTKTIYVGEDIYIKALSFNKISVEELNDKLNDGYKLLSDGSFSKKKEITLPNIFKK